jgi:hypothetical protein
MGHSTPGQSCFVLTRKKRTFPCQTDQKNSCLFAVCCTPKRNPWVCHWLTSTCLTCIVSHSQNKSAVLNLGYMKIVVLCLRVTICDLRVPYGDTIWIWWYAKLVNVALDVPERCKFCFWVRDYLKVENRCTKCQKI